MPGENRTIVLVVDDEPKVLGVIALILARAGYEVLPAPGGEEALEMLAACERPIALALCDIRLPGMDGYELIERIRAVSPSTKVMLTSGFVDERSLPDVPFLAKPFNKQQLLSATEEVLQRATRPRVRTAGG